MSRTAAELSNLAKALQTSLEELQKAQLSPVDVAVVDSGVDSTHKDLESRVAASWWVEDRNGVPTPVVCKTPLNNDAYGHGTGVAGIIAGIAPNARIIDVRVLDENNCGTGEVLVAGFRLAVEQGARLINLSLACKAKFASELNVICEQAYRRNQVVIAAKRNMPLVDNGFPAELSSCISVDLADFPSPFTLNFRRDDPIEYAARGVDVPTTESGGGYTQMTGTSFATPTISGLCALLVGAYPDLRPFEVKAVLKAFATQV